MRGIGWLAVAAGLSLCGCNVVVSDLPMFTVADEVGAPPLRLGVWAKPQVDCAFDPKAPVAAWPECADPMVIQAHRMVDPKKGKDSIPYLLAAGSPRVMQIVSQKKPLQGYVYGGVLPLKQDAQGRIVEAQMWIAQCGPPPPKPADGSGAPKDYVTRQPVEGLTIDTDSGNCKPRDADAVRRAAAASQAWGDTPSVIRWVRDGED